MRRQGGSIQRADGWANDRGSLPGWRGVGKEIQARREREWDLHIKNLPSQNWFQGVDLDWARKFHSFYGKQHDVESHWPWKRDIRKYVPSLYQEIAQLDEVHLDEDMSVMNNCRAQIAKLLGKPSIVHIHGALGAKHGFAPLTADRIAVWDKRQVKKLVDWGIPESRIIVEGYARRYNAHLGIGYVGNQRRVRKHLKLPMHHETWLVAPYTVHNFGDGGEDILMNSIRMIQEAIDLVPSRNYVIKLHPGCSEKSDIRFWKPWCAKRPNTRLVHKYDPWKLLMSCDGIIAHNTTYAIDAMVLGFGKKVVAIDDGMPSGYEEFLEEFTVARTEEDIRVAIHS